MGDLSVIDILLVEDDPNDAELALRAFKKRHVIDNVHWVKDGAEALDFLFARGAYAGRDMGRAPKVVLLDLKLPKVDGIEVLAQIKADPRTRAVPVVMLTSSQEDRDVLETYRLGVNSYICKPVDFEKFIEIVSEIELYWMVMNRTPK